MSIATERSTDTPPPDEAASGRAHPGRCTPRRRRATPAGRLRRGLGHVPSAAKTVTRGALSLPGRLSTAAEERPRRTFRVLVVALVVLAVVAGGLWWLAGGEERDLTAQDQALDVANDRVVGLLSYDYRTIDNQVARTADDLTGAFKDDYAKLVTDTIVQPAKDRQLSIQTTVAGRSVVEGDTDRVVLLMFLNQQSQESGTEPVRTGSRVRVTLEHQDSAWRISELRPV